MIGVAASKEKSLRENHRDVASRFREMSNHVARSPDRAGLPKEQNYHCTEITVQDRQRCETIERNRRT